MPQAKRSTSTRASSRFKQPAALKRLTTSLDTAQKALTELSKGGGRDVGKGAKDLYGDLRKFVADARKDSNRVAKALQREFEQAQKELAKAASGAKSSTRRASSSRSTAKRAGSSRSTSSRSSSSGSTSSRSTSSRSTGRGTTKRTSGSSSRRSTGTSKRGTKKS